MAIRSARNRVRGAITVNTSLLTLPDRPAKPRERGLTIVNDNGLPPGYFEDVIGGAGGLIDLVKFGWGTLVISDALERKTVCQRDQSSACIREDLAAGADRVIIERCESDARGVFCSDGGPASG